MDIRKQLLNILDQLPDTPAEHDLMPHLNNLNRIIQECETKEEYRGQQQQFEHDLNAAVPVEYRFIQIFFWMITAINQSKSVREIEAAIIIAAPALRRNMPAAQLLQFTHRGPRQE
jgi:hypothetical protein